MLIYSIEYGRNQKNAIKITSNMAAEKKSAKMWRLIEKVENKIKKPFPLFFVSLSSHITISLCLFSLSLSLIPLCQPQQMKPAPPPSAHCLSALSQLAPKNRDAQRFFQMNLTPHDKPSTDEP